MRYPRPSSVVRFWILSGGRHVVRLAYPGVGGAPVYQMLPSRRHQRPHMPNLGLVIHVVDESNAEDVDANLALTHAQTRGPRCQGGRCLVRGI
jgi:hypothetical protein